MKLTPSQVKEFVNLATYYYIDRGKGATLSQSDGRAVKVVFDGGYSYVIGGRGTVKQV